MSNRQEELMDLLLEQAMEEELQNEFKDMPSEEELREMYQLSDRFQRNMNRLLAEERKMDQKAAGLRKERCFYRITGIVAACLVCVLFLWQMPEVRGAVEDTVFRLYEDCMHMGSHAAGGDELLEPMKDPDYMPKEYIEVERIEEEKSKFLAYDGVWGTIKISYRKSANGEDSSWYDTDLNYSKKNLLNVIDAYWAHNDQKNIFWWENDDYLYCIKTTSAVPQEEIIKIAESIMR